MDDVTPPDDVWADDRISLQDSPIEGSGLFALGDIAEGVAVLRMGGTLVSSAELHALFDRAADDPDAAYIDTITVFEDAHLVLPPGTLLHFANHSCDPNMWHVGPYELATRRAVHVGDELTVDYATHSGADGFVMECQCGASICRGRVTNDDWQREELQHAYRGHWTPALQGRIDASKS